MNRRRLISIGLSAALFASIRNVRATPATTAELSPALDLSADASGIGSRPRLVIVLFSLPDCPYCEAIRREQLIPLARDAGQADRLVVREVSITGARTLLDFRGMPTTEREFARATPAKFSPTVAFFNPAGQQVVPAIVGARLPDFYGAYLDEAIRSAIAKVGEYAR